MKDAFFALELIEKACLEAAKYQLSMETKAREVECNRKVDMSLVTQVDIESEIIIRNTLSAHGKIVGEETPESHSLLGSDQDFFLVDPLDGTTSFRRFAGMRSGQVGYGPLISWCQSSKLVCACFYNLTSNTLFSAVKNAGVRYLQYAETCESLIPFEKRQELKVQNVTALADCAVLFHSVTGAELPLIANLVKDRSVENAYRFGGFANDAVRLAQGFEQIQIQYSVKAWDFSATLFPIETGYSIIIDPTNKKIPYSEWKISNENPVLVAPRNLLTEILQKAFR